MLTVAALFGIILGGLLMKAKKLKYDDDEFGAVLNCAVRYCIGRQTYMPDLVCGCVKQFLPYVNSRTLYCFEQDIIEAQYYGGYGDDTIDKPVWMAFLKKVQEEMDARNMTHYVDWRKQDAQGHNV